MSLFTYISDTRKVAKELHRIADALERAFPPQEAPVVRTPAQADDISYATDEDTAKQELKDEIEGYRREYEREKEE